MDIKAFKSAVATENRHFIAQGVRELQAEGHTEGEIFRLALSADAGLTRDTWADLVKDSLQKHPAEFPVDARVATHPATDAWMQGDRYGNVRGTNKHGLVNVKLDSGRTRAFKPEDLKFAF
jgi:hypothetical protein